MEIRETLTDEERASFDKMMALNVGKTNTQKLDAIFEWVVFVFGSSADGAEVSISRCKNCGQLIVNDVDDNFIHCRTCR